MDIEPVLRLAADYANSDPRKPAYVTFFHLSRQTDLALYFNSEDASQHISAARRRGLEIASDEEIYGTITQIVAYAVQRALTEYKEGQLFAALIVENLRNGRNALATGTDD